MVPLNESVYDHYCAEDSLWQGNGSFTPDYFKQSDVCPYPYLNKGYLNQSDYEPGDCSLTYADVDSLHWIISAAYTVLCIVPFFCSVLFYNKLRKAQAEAAKKRKGPKKKMSLMEILYLIVILYSFGLTISCLDMGGKGNIINNEVEAFSVGVGTASAMSVIFMLVRNWITILSAKGKTTKAPLWLEILFYVSVFLLAVMDLIVGVIENFLIGEAADIRGAYDGTTNAIKNGTTGLLLMGWCGLGFFYGVRLKMLLGKGEKISKEQAKIIKYTRALAFCGLVGGLYKATTLTRMGTIVYPPDPCSSSFVSPLHFVLISMAYTIIIVQRPNEEKMKKAIRQEEKSTFSSSSSVAPEE